MISRSREIHVAAATALAPMLWGTTYWTTTQVLPEGRPLLSATLRALPAGLALVLVLGGTPAPAHLRRLAALGALNIGAFFALLFVAAYRLPGGTAATLGALQPLFALGLTAWWLKVPARAGQIGAGAAGVIGVALVVGAAPARLDGLGVAAALAASGSMAAGIVLAKRWAVPVSPLRSTAWQLTFGGLLCLPLLLAVEGLPAGLSLSQAGGYAYMAVVSTALAYALWLRGLARLPVARVSVLALLSPVTAVTVDWAALGRQLGVLQLGGVALVLAGVVAGQLIASAAPREAA